MERKNSNQVKKAVRRRNRLSVLHKVVLALASVVVFCTTYALILPAIAMTPNTFCGKEEHTHSEGCYENVLVCSVHEHTDSCYETVRELVCTESESEGHSHTDDCYSVTYECCCGQEEREGHTHSEGCYSTYTECVCGQEDDPEHTHSEGCYVEHRDLVCGQDEYEGHTHSEGCYVPVYNLICGQDEYKGHHHTDSCYQDVEKLVCSLPADPNHVHDESCYEKKLICTKEEHKHSEMCYSDLSADVESEASWERSVPTLTGLWADDLVKMAKTQIGYKESTRNYYVVDGEKKGYTRYGAWYGDPYSDWSSTFASFCLYYARVGWVPYEKDASKWVKTLKEQNFYASADEYSPVKGDLVFFDMDGDNKSDHVGIISEVSEKDGKIYTIEGDSSDKVEEKSYYTNDGRIRGYCVLPENPAFAVPEEEPVENAEVEEVPAAEEAPAAQSTVEYPERPAAQSTVEYPEAPAEAESIVEEMEETDSMVESISEGPEEMAETESIVEDVVEPEEITVKTFEGPDYIVSVSYTQEAEIPAEAELRVSEYEKDSEEYQACYAEAVELNELNQDVDYTENFRLFDIGLYVDDEEIEPNASVDVKVTYISPAEAAAEVDEEQSEENLSEESPEYRIVHFEEENGAKVMDVAQSTEGSADVMEFTTDSFSLFGITTLAQPQYTLTYNDTKNAFMKVDPYKQYYNASSPLGVAGSFHIVAFDTVTQAAHTNGNILAKNLIGGHDFGTNPKSENPNFTDLSYIQNYLNPVSGRSGANENSYLVLGSSNKSKLESFDNGMSLGISGTKFDKPKNYVVDNDTANAPFIDLNEVENEVNALNASLASYPTTTGVSLTKSGDGHGTIKIAELDGASFLNIKASDLEAISDGLTVGGFKSDHNGSLIINVDCSDISDVFNMDVHGNGAVIAMDDIEQPTPETTVFTNGKVIWNFINTNNISMINTGKVLGAIIAPNATVNITSNVNGTIIGKNVIVSAESHRCDFTGTTIPVNASIEAVKTVNGAVPVKSEVFSFKLEELKNGSWNTIKNDVKNVGSQIVFSSLSYNSTNDPGTHWYRISENSDNEMLAKGYQFDTTKFIIKVVVTSKNVSGDTKYEAAAAYYEADDVDLNGNPVKSNQQVNNPLNSKPTFNNTKPEPEKAVIKAVKTISGNDAPSIDTLKFKFELRKAQLNSQGKLEAITGDGALLDTKENNGSEISFSELTFNQEGTYYYQISEKAGTDSNWQYDTNVYYCKIEVKKGSDGKLGVTKTYLDKDGKTLDDNKKPEFVNKYGVTEIEVEKKWFKNGQDVTATTSGSITFDLMQTATVEGNAGGSSDGSGSTSGQELKIRIEGRYWNQYNGTSCTKEITAMSGQPITVTYKSSAYSTQGWWKTLTQPNDQAKTVKATKIANNIYQFTVTPNEDIIIIFPVGNDGDDRLIDVSYTRPGAAPTPTPTPAPGSSEPTTIRYGTYTISDTAPDRWHIVISDLPTMGNKDGTIVKYTYSVVEHQVPNCNAPTYENNDGITSGKITIKNDWPDIPEYTLPETGGPGTLIYVMIGLLLMAMSMIIFAFNLRFKRERRYR